MLQAERGRARGQLVLFTAVLVHIWLRLHVACNNADADPWLVTVPVTIPVKSWLWYHTTMTIQV